MDDQKPINLITTGEENAKSVKETPVTENQVKRAKVNDAEHAASKITTLGYQKQEFKQELELENVKQTPK